MKRGLLVEQTLLLEEQRIDPEEHHTSWKLYGAANLDALWRVWPARNYVALASVM